MDLTCSAKGEAKEPSHTQTPLPSALLTSIPRLGILLFFVNQQHYGFLSYIWHAWPELEWTLHHPLPLIPLSTHKYKEVMCYTCRFSQDLRDRPDITPDTRPPPTPTYPWAPPGPHPPPQAHGAAGPQPETQKGQPAPPPQQQGPTDYK
ncbi:hypothetical protein N7478_004152 [Penicillium angulare]|uniref:uncharacterized protein n=1 Tax=Penicillium angulare TaxID=116970 RepID=UPI002540D1DA|nr:uncharacterized protein N7478_004152 [Penicillium angulare]KAJ5278780.1 hypothetical protein N7478_004152 [Penicillium angulare]